MNNNKTFTFTLDLKHIIWALAALNVLTIFLWKPWETRIGDNARTVTVAGQAIIEAEPDLYTFSPSFNFTNDSQSQVLSQATKKADEVVAGLKKLGVEDKDIRLDASSYEQWWKDMDDDSYNSSIYITVEVDTKELAQKVQDFLVKADAEGQITPYATFSEGKQKELEVEAREKAVADAKSKAERSASELGARLGAVISISDDYGFGVYPMYGRDTVVESSDGANKTSLPIQPGQNEFTFNVTVVFEIK